MSIASSRRVKSADLTLLSFNANTGYYDMDTKSLEAYNAKARKRAAADGKGNRRSEVISKSSIRNFVKYVNHLSEAKRKESEPDAEGKGEIQDILVTMRKGMGT